MTTNEEYLLAFGRIVWSFADLEYHYQRVLVMAKKMVLGHMLVTAQR